jgi:hypothetical protein
MSYLKYEKYMNWKTGTLSVILLIILSRLPLLWESYFHADEALFALSAKVWMQGGIPYVHWFETKPLGVYCFYAFASWLSRSLPDINMLSVHLFYFLWTGLTAWGIGSITSRLGPQTTTKKQMITAGWLSAIFFILFSSFWDPSITSVSIEVVLLLPLVLSIAILPSDAESQKIWRSFLSGVFASAAFLCKQQAGIMFPIILIYFGFILWRSSSGWRFSKVVAHSASFLLGLIPLSALMIGYLIHAGSWDGFYYWNILYNSIYINQGNTAGDLFTKILTQVLRHIASTALLWFLAVDLLLINRRMRSKHSSYEWLVWVWLVLSIIPVCVGKRFEDHYFLFMIPALSILSAYALTQWSPERLHRWRTALLVALILPSFGSVVTRIFAVPLTRKFGGEDMNVYRPYGEYLREKTKPGDRILVWGCAPAVYLFADRPPASRFHRTDILAGRLAGIDIPDNQDVDVLKYQVPEAWEMFFDDMKQFPPVYIMDTGPTGHHDFLRYQMTRYPRLMEFVKKHYVQEPSFMNATMYRRKD